MIATYLQPLIATLVIALIATFVVLLITQQQRQVDLIKVLVLPVVLVFVNSLFGELFFVFFKIPSLVQVRLFLASSVLVMLALTYMVVKNYWKLNSKKALIFSILFIVILIILAEIWVHLSLPLVF